MEAKVALIKEINHYWEKCFTVHYAHFCFSNVSVTMYMNLCHGIISVMQGYSAFYFCVVWISVSLSLAKKEVDPVCHTRQVAFATAGAFWEIRGNAHLVGMFCTHFSSLLSQPIHHVYRSESKFGLITQPRQSYNFYFREFSDFVEGIAFL